VDLEVTFTQTTLKRFVVDDNKQISNQYFLNWTFHNVVADLKQTQNK